MKVENLEHKNQFVIKGFHPQYTFYTFQSYESEICTLKDWHHFDREQDQEAYTGKTLELKGNMWDYSNTTRKHFKLFLERYSNIPYKNKAQFLKEIQINKYIQVV